ncbi:MAG: DegV family protein [Clostridiales bacterium]|jgi:DegV family protein with EDD domain|nr:DegV family protein [Clostridiales bacterium]
MAVVFCDTNCELWFDLAKELGLQVIKMPYTLDGVEYYYDLGEKTDFKKFYSDVKSGKMPSTSALNAENYKEYFEPYFQKGEDILYLSFSDKLSATFTFMDQAVAELKEKYPNVKFVRFDTKGVSMTAGFQVYAGKKFFDTGKTIEETVEFLNDFTKHVCAEFVVDDLRHLKRGGRISGFTAAIGTLLNFKPILRVTEEGTLVNKTKVNGKAKAISYLVEQVKEKALDLGKYPIVIVHADCEDEALKLKEKIIQETGNDKLDIWVQMVGPVVGTHCGPGTIALIFYAVSR